MDDFEGLAMRFEQERPRLRAVAYQMLGSLADAEDAVHEVWLWLRRAEATVAENLTAAVASVSLNMLRARNFRREQLLKAQVPDPLIGPADDSNREHETLLAGSVGLAPLVVLETLSPGQRLAFVLHDMFSVPFDEIAAILERSPEATRQLASRARRYVRQEAPVPDVELARQWKVTDAFIAATRQGDLDALVAVLDPDVVLRSDGGRTGLSRYGRGAQKVARQALTWSHSDLIMRRALINRAAGVVSIRAGKPYSVAAVTVKDEKIVELDILADPERLARLDLAVVDG